MWMVAGANKKLDGPLGSYSVLTDPCLGQYFSNSALRRHLLGMGLIRRDGSIIPETVYRQRHQRRLQKQTANEELATAIVKKTLDIERMRQAEIQKHLDDLTKIEMVERVRSARSGRRNRSAPPGPKGDDVSKPLMRRGRSAPSQDKIRKGYTKSQQGKSTRRRRSARRQSSRHQQWKNSSFQTSFDFRPLSAPVNLDRENVQADNFDITDEEYNPPLEEKERFHISRMSRPKSAHPKHRMHKTFNQSAASDVHEPSLEKTQDGLNPTSGYLHALQQTFSPYLRPLLRDLRLPVSAGMEPRPQTSHRRVRTKEDLRELTIRDLLDWNSQDHIPNIGRKKKKNKPAKTPLSHSMLPVKQSGNGCSITWRYLGNTFLQTTDHENRGSEVTVFQQHCGGANILLYRGRLKSGETFSFSSRRRRGFPFSVTVFVDGVRNLKLSTCCETRHPSGSKLGGTRGQFQAVSYHWSEGPLPCLRCEAERRLGRSGARNFSTTVQRRPSSAAPNYQQPKSSTLPEKRSVTVDHLQMETNSSNSIRDLSPDSNKEREPETAKCKKGVTEEIFVPVDDVVHTESEADEIDELSNGESENDSEEDSVEEEIQRSTHLTVAAESTPLSTSGGAEDLVSGDYQSAEYNADSDELYEEDDEDASEEEEEEDDDVFGDSRGVSEQGSKSRQAFARQSSSSKSKSVSGSSRVRLPSSHWGASHDPQTQSFSSDEEGQPLNPVTEVQVDVHVNPSRHGSIASNQ